MSSRARRSRTAAGAVAWLALALVVAGCGNNPYPASQRGEKILYGAFSEAPKTLDPARAYTTAAHEITGATYATLLEYHYLRRPYELIPGIVVDVPHAEALDDGRVRYRFELLPGVRYAPDPCFALGDPDASGAPADTREVVAADVAFALARIADPTVISPILEPLSSIADLAAFGSRLAERQQEPAFRALPAHERYRAVGPIAGVRVEGDHAIEIILDRPNPQILYWFAMPFTSPMPWEAIAYYDGREGRPPIADHPVGAGPYQLVEYDKNARMVLAVNPNWYGLEAAPSQAPGTVYPADGEPGDAEAGLLASAGTPLPRIERVVLTREKEPIPAFTKFLQGYYDASGIIQESFDKVIREDRLSPDMTARGVQLSKSVSPDVYYIGFNMLDPVVGGAGGERSRKLRQAMSLTVDIDEYLRLFANGRGVPAQTPIPPGIFGHDPTYRNPYRRVDVDRARRLLEAAGYPRGIDAATGKPLRLTFDSADPSVQGKIRTQFLIDGWRKLGLDVELAATNYNQFQEKVKTGAYQIFTWGWVADYPDPENFLFLLYSEMARSKNEGPNSANFEDPRYDALFLAMKDRPNDAERLRLIHEMRAILEDERPWIELFHRETYALYHSWYRDVKPFGMSFPMFKYQDIDPALRTELRERWNQPIRWPAYLLVAIVVVVVVPAIRTFVRERT